MCQREDTLRFDHISYRHDQICAIRSYDVLTSLGTRRSLARRVNIYLHPHAVIPLHVTRIGYQTLILGAYRSFGFRRHYGSRPSLPRLAFFLLGFGFDSDLIVLVIVTEANFVDAGLAGLMAEVRLTFRATTSPVSTFSLIVGVKVCVIAFFSKFPK
jgi:hypothetical protein